MAGTGANSTAEAIELAAFAAKAGAQAHLSVVPYYNKPTQEGLYRHFRTIAEKVALPMILYNVPGRTVADLSNDTDAAARRRFPASSASRTRRPTSAAAASSSARSTQAGHADFARLQRRGHHRPRR